jgi:PAS domain S-box-containing protein
MAFVESKAVLRLLTVVALAAASPLLLAQPAAQQPRVLRVVMDDDYAPFVFRSEQGVLQGILVDQWRAWEKATGVRVELHAVDWGVALRGMQAGEFDVIDTIVQTPERTFEFDFTPAYATIGGSIFFRNDISGITDIPSLEGFPVGVKAGDQHVNRLEETGITTIIWFPNYNAIVQAAKRRRINVFVADEPAALYLLNKAGIDGEFRHSGPIFRDGLRRAVHKGDVHTLHLVTEGFAAVGPEALKAIDHKWFGRPVRLYEQYLGYVGYGAAALLLIILALFGWNSALRRKILQRTAALAESEQRFRQIAENLSEVFWLVKIDGTAILYVSSAYETVWGRTREELYRDPQSFFSAIHPEDRGRVSDAIHLNRNDGFAVEYRIVRPDSSVRWVWDRGFPIKDADGHVYRLAGIAEDITDRKLAAELVRQAEERIRLIINTIPAMVWCLRPDGVTEFVNQRWLDYMGISLAEITEQPTSTVHPDDLQRVVERWQADKTAGMPSEDEMRLRRADGTYNWFIVRTVPLRDAAGNIVSWYGTSADIEGRKQAEEQLRRSEDDLKATSEQLRALSARLQSAREEEGMRIAREIHDELGGSLTSLRWDLESVRKAAADSGLREKLTAMLGMTDTMIQIVRRIASDLRPAVLDVLGLEEALEWQARQFENRTGIGVHYESAGIDVELNPAQSTTIFRIFQEALTNVLRHASASRVDVIVAEDTGTLVLMISDDGRGITENERTGERSIGLVGMRERAHLIGGEIDVSGIEGDGTTVTLRLPIRDAIQPPAPIIVPAGGRPLRH